MIMESLFLIILGGTNYGDPAKAILLEGTINGILLSINTDLPPWPSYHYAKDHYTVYK